MGRSHLTMDLLLELLQFVSFTLISARAGLPIAWRRGDRGIFHFLCQISHQDKSEISVKILIST